MAEQDNIQLGMSVDIKEAIGSLKEFGQEVKDSIGKDMSSELAEMRLQAAQLKDEIKGLTAAEKKLSDEFGSQAFELPALKKEMGNLVEQIETKKTALKALNNEIKNMGEGLETQTPILQENTSEVRLGTLSTGAYRTAISQSIYALQELSPELGLVARSMSPVIQGFSLSAVKGQGFKAVLSAIGAQIMGPVGIGIALATLASIITMLIKSGKEAKETFRDMFKDGNIEAEKLLNHLIKTKEQMEEMAEPGFFERTWVNALVGTGLGASEIKKRVLEYRELINELRLGNLTIEESNRLAKIRVGLIGKTKDQIKEEIKSRQLNRTEIKHIVKALDDELDRFPATSEGYKQIKNTIDALNESMGKHNEKLKEEKVLLDQLITSDKEIRAQILEINKALATQGLSYREINLLIKQRKELVEDLLPLTKEMEAAIEKALKKPEDPTKRAYEVSPVPGVPKPDLQGYIDEQYFLIQKNLLLEDIKFSAERTGRALISAWSSSVQVLKNNNSMLQQFINMLGKAILEVLALRAAMILLDFLTGGIGGMFVGTPKAPPVPALLPGGGLPKLGSPGLTPGANRSSGVQRIIHEVRVTGKIDNRTIRLAYDSDKYLQVTHG